MLGINISCFCVLGDNGNKEFITDTREAAKLEDSQIIWTFLCGDENELSSWRVSSTWIPTNAAVVKSRRLVSGGRSSA